MTITLRDGSTMERRFPHGITGFVAFHIEIDAEDIRAMREMAARDPERFNAAMLQLENRFPERRAKR